MVEASACKAGLSGFEFHRHPHSVSQKLTASAGSTTAGLIESSMKWWEWVFGGIGVFGLGLRIEWLRRRSRSSTQAASITAQGAKVTDSPVASGTGIVQTVNSPIINVSLPGAPGTTDTMSGAN